MTRTDVIAFAEQEMQKTIEGKSYRLQNAAKQIAAKAYREGMENGYSLAREIVTAKPEAVAEAFNLTEGGSVFNVLLNFNVDNAERAWNEYQDVQIIKQQLPDSCYGLHIGDEFTQYACIGVVTGLTPGRVHILWSDGSVGDRARSMMNTAHPTGRHYGDLSDILAALQKGPDHD